MMCRAKLACRSPPRLSRWRVVRPLLAGTGATPQRWAKAASERSRSGLSPAVTSILSGDLGADPGQLQEFGCGDCQAWRSRSASVIASVSVWQRRGQTPQGELGRFPRVVEFAAGAQSRAGVDEDGGAHA